MRGFLRLPFIIAIGLFVCRMEARAVGQSEGDGSWTAEFGIEEGELSAAGRNPYFILEPGYQLVFEGRRERLIITVLDETKTVAGVETRVVEERETKDGKLAEVSRNFFAISKRTNGVFYFGEEVDIFKDGKVVGREGGGSPGRKAPGSGC